MQPLTIHFNKQSFPQRLCKKLFAALLLGSIGLGVKAQTIRYDFAAPNAVHHEAEITITADKLPAGPALFRMSRSSPGRYATHEFGKNVYNVKATDSSGKTLSIEKVAPDVYRVSAHKGAVKLSYTLYGNHPDGTYAGIDATNYHLNMPASFMWVKGLEKAPITLHFAVPDTGWKVATQLKPTADRYTFTAPNLQYFMDAPTKVGPLHINAWQIINPDGKSYTIRLALEAAAPDTLVNNFAGKLQRLVREAQAVFGEVPAYDYGTYTFLASINPYVRGDGMEHRNSTMIALPTTFTGSNDLLDVFAHEYFHCWNVERIRPKSLEPFNFEHSNMSEGLWVAEGFTQYYGELLMRRAGFTAEEGFTGAMSGLINAKENTPGGRFYTPIENSQRAPFVDAGVAVDRTNYPNMFTSYYLHGGALALALDLQLRAKYNKTLDDYMRELWKRFGKPEVPYTIPGLQEALAAVTDKTFAAGFFDQYVYNAGSIDYNSLLAPAGYTLQKAAAGKAWLGNVRLTAGNDGLVVNNNTLRGTPLYEAGVDVDDVLVHLDGKDLKTTEALQQVLTAHKPGEVLPLVYLHRGQRKEATVTTGENPALQIVDIAANGGSLTNAQSTFRKAWQSSKGK